MTVAPPRPPSTIGLRVEPDVTEEIDRSLRRRLKRRCQRMVAALGLGGTELSVLLAGDNTVANLNETWRKKKGTTDVLSFPQATPELIESWTTSHPPKGGAPDGSADGPERILGDLVISLEVVRRRSPGPDAFEQDLVTLLAHGLIHLLGHDHQSDPDRKAMLALQDRLVTEAQSRGRVQRVS
jgi:probable rRNA maturation factor